MTSSFRSETFELSTDTHLADRARLGSAPAFDELVARHAERAVAMAMVVTGDAGAAVATGIQAFTNVLDQMASGGYSIDDPYVPGLLRSARELALADTTAEPELRERMDRRLPELARSCRWLTTASAFTDVDVALALDIEDHAAEGIIAWSDAVIADHADAVDAVLRNVHVLIPGTFAADSRALWRQWLATAGVSGPVGLVDRPRRLAAIEPVAGRILRGAAVLLMVVGVVGAAVGIGTLGDGSGAGRSTESAQRAAVERSTGTENAAGTANGGTTANRSANGSAADGTAGLGQADGGMGVATPGPGPATSVATTGVMAPGGGSGQALDTAAGGMHLPSHARGSAATSSGTTGASTGPVASGPTGATSPGSTPASPAAAPWAPAAPSGPAATSPAPAPKPTPPDAPAPVKPSAPRPPATTPPAATPPAPSVTVPSVVAPIVGTVTGVVSGVTGGLGLGR